jgi:endo-alpha-1,4-polygalactosaminidase (GH114 family)
MIGAYLMVCFGASLRGNEGLYLEGSALVSLIKVGNSTAEVEEGLGHVCAPLLGRFKSEIGEDKYVAVMVNVSWSGLRFRLWLERLAWVLVQENKEGIAGPAFCHNDSNMYRSYVIDCKFHKALSVVQIERQDLIPLEVNVEDMYSTFRSLRRGSLSRATEEGISGTDLDMINRWRKFENNKGGKPHMSMREHYLEIKLVIRRMLSYSKAL